jgi:hypothetical protein
MPCAQLALHYRVLRYIRNTVAPKRNYIMKSWLVRMLAINMQLGNNAAAVKKTAAHDLYCDANPTRLMETSA